MHSAMHILPHNPMRRFVRQRLPARDLVLCVVDTGVHEAERPRRLVAGLFLKRGVLEVDALQPQAGRRTGLQSAEFETC